MDGNDRCELQLSRNNGMIIAFGLCHRGFVCTRLYTSPITLIIAHSTVNTDAAIH